jgi:hypothetical protein
LKGYEPPPEPAPCWACEQAQVAAGQEHCTLYVTPSEQVSEAEREHSPPLLLPPPFAWLHVTPGDGGLAVAEPGGLAIDDPSFADAPGGTLPGEVPPSEEVVAI